MDMISEILIAAIEKAKNAVVKIDNYSVLRGNERFAGLGSGFVFSSDGLILTNAHVIEKSTRLKVSLLDGNDFGAEVIGSDKDTDIAIIKIFGSGYTPLKTWGSQNRSKLASWLLPLAILWDISIRFRLAYSEVWEGPCALPEDS